MVVEDEEAISRVLAAYIRRAGFDCLICRDGIQAVESFDRLNPSLVILDVLLPGKSGWEVLKHIRDKGACPVIMLTSKGDVNDRIKGLNEGADDYIAKPFEPEEVIARIHAVLRRPTRSMISSEQATFGSFRVDFNSRMVFLNGASLSITPRDLSLLMFLAEHPNQIFTREQLIENVWGSDYEGSDRAVDLAIMRIRKLLFHWPPEEGELKTLRGTGYQLYVNIPN
jgi:DNA-binding response OmpR family regulator